MEGGGGQNHPELSPDGRNGEVDSLFLKLYQIKPDASNLIIFKHEPAALKSLLT